MRCTLRKLIIIGILAIIAMISTTMGSMSNAEADSVTPWVNDGSAKGGGYYLDPIACSVWTPDRGWHRPSPSGPILWVDYRYGPAGGFYWDPVSCWVWTSDADWHAFNPAGIWPSQPASGGSTQPTAPATSFASLPVDLSHDGWTIKANANIDTDPIVRDWLKRLRPLAPQLWPTAPNVPNKLVPDFRVQNGDEVPDGLEYTADWNTPFCQQDRRCDWIVPSGAYRYVAGDYAFWPLGIDHCTGETNVGFQIWLYNVGDSSHTWRNQCADNGGTRHGRFWNGDRLEWGVWGAASHETANMLNLSTEGDGNSLNRPGRTNAGSNCGKRDACKMVDITIVIQAGDRILAVAMTRYAKP